MTVRAVHAEFVEGRSAASGRWRVLPVAWADRENGTCPRCGQPTRIDPGCPVVFDTQDWAGGVVEVSQQHGCGEWLAVTWAEGVDVADLPGEEQDAALRALVETVTAALGAPAE